MVAQARESSEDSRVEKRSEPIPAGNVPNKLVARVIGTGLHFLFFFHESPKNSCSARTSRTGEGERGRDTPSRHRILLRIFNQRPRGPGIRARTGDELCPACVRLNKTDIGT